MYFVESWPQITLVQIELIVSIALLGAFLGSLIAGPFSNSFGRKPVIIVADIMFVTGTII